MLKFLSEKSDLDIWPWPQQMALTLETQGINMCNMEAASLTIQKLWPI